MERFDKIRYFLGGIVVGMIITAVIVVMANHLSTQIQ